MGNPPNAPGQKCRVIGGRMAFNGEGKGPNQGKVVITEYLHAEKAGLEQENVWQCKATNGDVLQTYYGAGASAAFLECWLEVQEPDVEPPAELVLTVEQVPTGSPRMGGYETVASVRLTTAERKRVAALGKEFA